MQALRLLLVGLTRLGADGGKLRRCHTVDIPAHANLLEQLFNKLLRVVRVESNELGEGSRRGYNAN